MHGPLSTPVQLLVNFYKMSREDPDIGVEWLTQCGAGKKTARRIMSNTFFCNFPRNLGV